ETEPDSAMLKLAEMADGFLHHNRPILRGIDDSVIRPAAARAIVIRSGRGLAPTALPLETGIPLLATGGQQKNAIALSNCSQAILGPHTGDLDSLSTCQHFHRQREALCQLYQCEPQYIVHDLHPDYYSTRWARQQSLPTIEVQHHHAHIASVMLEHGLLGEQVLGLVCDGTGYGNDGTIWGGEFLLASSKEFKRVGHLMPFSLPGGEAAIHEPWRIAAALLSSACGTERAMEICDLQFMSKSAKSILPLIQSGNHSPKTTSLGRLFDGFAALILERDESRFDGEFPMLLEARATQNSTTAPYRFPIIESSDHYELDWREAIEQLVLDLQSDCPETEMATRFHLGLASGLCDGVMLVPDVPIVLAGGCFQNRLLLELVVDQLRNRGRNVFWSQRLPINDGGLAAGQLAIASALISQFS
ncbi:MAG: carbamoyltransferase HypF, partial [Planctomycetaceae bacterium]|nr:carbamoyltransferase HypF [Planctomycetaceae bacterium]